MKIEDIKILVACEESQTVCKAFRKLGFEAYSCDLQECSGGHPKWHIQGDAIEQAYSGRYNVMIAHPPCTELTIRGAYHTYRRGSYLSRLKAAEFFIKLAEAPVEFIAVENPIGIMSTIYRKYDQIIQPYYFGDAEQKKTCLWLKNLPKLNATNVVEPTMYFTNTGKKKSFSDRLASVHISERAKQRSKTFPGIASAMATQWGEYLLNQ